MIDEAYEKHTAAGLDFNHYVDGYINGFIGEPDTYFLKGPDWFIMGHHGRIDPTTGLEREYWHIHYLATRRKNRLDILFKWMPYHLPEIGIARPLKNSRGLQFYKTDRLLKLCRHFRKTT